MATLTVTKDVAEAICDAVLSIDGVAGLSSGRMGQAFFRAPGTLIEGLQVLDDSEHSEHGAEGERIVVHLIYDLSSRREIPQLVEEVRTAVLAVPALAQADGSARVDVVVADAVRHAPSRGLTADTTK